MNDTESRIYTIHTEFRTHVIEADDHGCFDGGILSLHRNGKLVMAFKDWRLVSCKAAPPPDVEPKPEQL